MRTLKLTIAYDGTTFLGWQRQARGPSIQGLLEGAVARLEGGPVTAVGAGRTDAGVHALAQVASVRVCFAHDAETVGRALNACLPAEVRVLRVEEAPDGFHARHSARAKVYRYVIATGEAMSPFLARYAWHVRHTLDVGAMREAARAIQGSHDFVAFQSAGSAAATTLRTVFESAIREEVTTFPCGWPDDGHTERPGPPRGGPAPGATRLGPAAGLTYEVRGDGFLRHMVRAIVGTLVEIGSGRRAAREMAELVERGSRAAAGPTAPARGLFLVRVDYD